MGMLIPPDIQPLMSDCKEAWNLFSEQWEFADARISSCGGNATKNGKILERITEYNVQLAGVHTKQQPKHTDWFGNDNRRGDLQLYLSTGTSIHVECKQLGDVGSHFDKLSHYYLNLMNGCFGSHSWLVYDYDRECCLTSKVKISKLIQKAEEVSSNMRPQGIHHELVLIDDLNEMLKKYGHL